MRKPDRLTTLYIDFDAFFANVEKHLDPALANRPVAVSPLDSDYSSLIAQCYIAKASGLKRGMRVNEAKALCPDLAVRTARHDVYVKIHHQIIREVEHIMPVKKVWSIDEVECDLGTRCDDKAVDLARQVRDRIATHIGPLITPSIGLSSNQLLAKIAAEMEKPNGFTILHPNALPGRLAEVELGDIPGVAAGMIARLTRAGITTTSELYNLSPKHVRAIWGNVEGERLWSQLHGYPVMRPATQKRMFGHSRVLTRDWQTVDKAGECLKLLTAKAARRLRFDDFLTSKMTVGLKLGDGEKRRIEVAFPPARDDFTCLRQSRKAFQHLCRNSAAQRIRSVSVMLHGLSRAGEIADDLFTSRKSHKENTRHNRLSDIMDSLNSKHGADVLHLGTRKQPPGGYAGAKIAFGRVPSLEDFAKPASARDGANARSK